jgi:hypothetical protein
MDSLKRCNGFPANPLDSLRSPRSIADPSLDYESGEAVRPTDQEEVLNHFRQAAVTETAAFVAGLARFFDLLWEHESVAEV